MTTDVLAGAGVMVTEPHEGAEWFQVTGPQTCRPGDRSVEADWSQAGFWYATAGVGNAVAVTGMNPHSAQGDRVVDAWKPALEQRGEVVLDVSDCPDLVPPLAAWAALRAGTTRLTNAARLRIKESDRLAAVTAALNAMGARVEEFPEELLIHGVGSLKGGAIIDCCNDHRIAMMCAVAATRANGGETVLQGAECVRKSYPDFWQVYRALGGDFDVLDLGE